MEVPPQSSDVPLHNDCVLLLSDVNIFWNVDSLLAEKGLHSHSRWGKAILLLRALDPNTQGFCAVNTFY